MHKKRTTESTGGFASVRVGHLSTANLTHCSKDIQMEREHIKFSSSCEHQNQHLSSQYNGENLAVYVDPFETRSASCSRSFV